MVWPSRFEASRVWRGAHRQSSRHLRTQVQKLCKSEDPSIVEAATTVVTAWKDAVKREAGSGDLRRGSSGVSEPQLSVSLRRGSVASQDSLQGGGKDAANGVTPSSRAPVSDNTCRLLATDMTSFCCKPPSRGLRSQAVWILRDVRGKRRFH